MDLNTYRIDPQAIKFFDDTHDNTEWFNIVAGYRSELLNSSAKKWLLFEADTFLFSAMFYALLSAGKSIVLPQNAQSEHIREIKKHTQASIGCDAISPDLPTSKDWPSQPLSSIEIEGATEVTFFTSGSTGQAKAILKQYHQLQTEVDCLETNFGEKVKDTVFLSTVSHQHIYGLLFKVLWPFAKKHGVVCQAFEYPEHIVNQVNNQNIADFTLVASPAHLHRLQLDNPLLSVQDRLKGIFSSGGPLDADANIALQQNLNCQLTEVYGSTETGGIAWRNRDTITDDDWHTFAGVTVAHQADSDLLLLSSPYLNQNQYCGDDKIALISPTQFRLLGRADDVVKIEEKRISLQEVQQRCKQHQYVHDVCVLVIGKKRKQLAAVIELNALGKEAKNTMPIHLFNRMFKGYLAQWFEAVTLPKRFRYPPQLPYNSQGKLNRKAMESDFE
ncbi:AMP-binding protein [uncultured Paraglaciecola sp.]|uniref:AMP-binding protein n=1 Tax=uncultured Paraglaciecola sp. TaxID=1765024 RepID=UPI00261BF753|nr:AMP-binding protein [uncultured Paraglaciecola sp.]